MWPLHGRRGHVSGKALAHLEQDQQSHPSCRRVFQIVPVPHQAWAHTRWPTSGMVGAVRDRPQTGLPCDSNASTCCDPRPGCGGPWPAPPCCGGSSPPNPCCEEYYPQDTIVCIDKALSTTWSAYDRTDVTCSDVMSGSGLTSVKIQLTQGGQFHLETFGDITPPVTFYFRFPYSPCNVAACNAGTECGVLWPPQFITWVFTVN